MINPPSVGVVSPGEMGSQVGRVLREAGSSVVTTVAGRSQATAARAKEAGLEALPGLDDVVRRAQLIISVVPSLSARPLADQVAAAMRRTDSRPLYLDLNAIGPHTARAIAEALAAVGGDFVDGSIIGNAQHLGDGAMFYLSGKRAPEVAGYLEPSLETYVLGGEPGQASGFKILYAGLTKSLASLGFEILAGAERLGCREQLLEKYRASLPSVADFFEHTLPHYPPRCGRRSQEMAELADTLEGLGLSANMAHAAQATLASVAARYKGDGGPDGEGLEAMVTWWARGAGAPHPGSS